MPAGHFGHPGIAFGGYVAGILAQHAPRGVKVDFRRPAPVGVEMTLAASGPGTELRLNGEILQSPLPISLLFESLDPHHGMRRSRRLGPTSSIPGSSMHLVSDAGMRGHRKTAYASSLAKRLTET